MKMSIMSNESMRELHILKELKGIDNMYQLVKSKVLDGKFVLFIVELDDMISLEEFIIQNPDYFKDFNQVMNFVKKLATGLRIVHKKGFIHANIKPTSIFVNDQNEPVLFDFQHSLTKGKLSKIENPESSIMTPEMKMSIDYDKKIENDERIDVFYLGMLIYELYKGNLSQMLHLNAHYKLFLESTVSFSKGDLVDFYNLIFKSLQTLNTRLSFERYINLIRKVADYPSTNVLEEGSSYQLIDYATDAEKNMNDSIDKEKSAHFKSSFFDNTAQSEDTGMEVEILEEVHHHEEENKGSLLTEILLVIFFFNWFLFFGLIFLYILHLMNKRKMFDFLMDVKKKEKKELKEEERDDETVITCTS
jgi:serine/threonine protein kinase